MFFRFGPFWPCVFFFSCRSLASCILSLSRLGKLHCRKPGCNDPGLQGDRGHCNPPQWNLVMTMVTVCAWRRGRQPPNESRAVSSAPGFVGAASVVCNFRSRFRLHVGWPLWLRLFLASFLACWPPYLLPSWVLSFLGFARKWFL